MKERLLSWGTLLCLIVLTTLVLIHALAVFPGVEAMRWFFRTTATVISRLDAPAWAQAITAALAIVAASAAVVWQQRKQADAGRQDEIRKLKILASGLFNCRIVIEYLETQISLAGVPADRELADLRSHLDALERIPPFDYPSWPAFHAIQAAAEAYKPLEPQILQTSRTLSQRAWDAREKHLARANRVFLEAERLVAESILELKGELQQVRCVLADGHIVYSYGHPQQPKN